MTALDNIADDSVPGFTTVGEAAKRVVERTRRVDRVVALGREIILIRSGYRRPLGEYGWRQMLSWIATFGANDTGRSVNWDLDPIRWGMEHEIQAAWHVAAGLTTTEAAE